jgi:hypothetical protein
LTHHNLKWTRQIKLQRFLSNWCEIKAAQSSSWVPAAAKV